MSAAARNNYNKSSHSSRRPRRSTTALPFESPKASQSLVELSQHPVDPTHLRFPRNSSSTSLDTQSTRSRPSVDSYIVGGSRTSKGMHKHIPPPLPAPLRLQKSLPQYSHYELTPDVIEVVPPTPTSTGHGTSPTTPLTPEFQRPTEEEHRRRQLAKVTRTLGERIPAELVFHGSGGVRPKAPSNNRNSTAPRPSTAGGAPRQSQPQDKAPNTGRRASLSLSTLTNFSPAPSALFAPSRHSRDTSRDVKPVKPTSADNSQRARKSSAASLSSTRPRRHDSRPNPIPINLPPPITLTPPTIPAPPPFQAAFSLFATDTDNDNDTRPSSPPEPAKPVQAPGRVYPQVQAQPLAQTLGRSSSTLSRAPSIRRRSATLASRPSLSPDAPFANSVAPVRGKRNRLHPAAAAANNSVEEVEEMKETVVRKERKEGWSGEWNRPDMQDVISQLRSLK